MKPLDSRAETALRQLDGTNVVIASEAWRSRATAAALRSPGSPRRFAPRDDDSVKARRTLASRKTGGVLRRPWSNPNQLDRFRREADKWRGHSAAASGIGAIGPEQGSGAPADRMLSTYSGS